MIRTTQNPDRIAQQIRILKNGPAGPEDYEEVQYLKEKGFANAEVQPSYMRENYGKPINAVWGGPTATGRDYLDELLDAQILEEQKEDKLPDSNAKQDLPNGNLNSGNQQPPETPSKLRHALRQASKTTWFLWITASAAVVGGIAYQVVSKVLALHFEIFQ